MKLNHIIPLVQYVFTRHRNLRGTPLKCQDGRLFYILNGSGVCINGASYAFSKDTVCLWNAGTVHFWDCNGKLILYARILTIYRPAAISLDF